MVNTEKFIELAITKCVYNKLDVLIHAQGKEGVQMRFIWEHIWEKGPIGN